MVTESTVLVVGAGASIPYGYPSGVNLVTQIVNELANNPQVSDLGQKVATLRFGYDDLMKFANELKYSGLYSVDAFLGTRPEFVEVGKTVIAAALVPFELEHVPFDGNLKGNWYRYLFNQLNTNLIRGGNEQLTILTFNYDRSLEYYLHSCFRHTWGMDGPDLHAKMSRLAIRHLHGSLSPLPFYAQPTERSRAYGHGRDSEGIGAAAKSIRIIHEAEDTDKEFAEASRILRLADRVCFLGFGYHYTNPRRLLPSAFKHGRTMGHIIGSAHGKTRSERDEILRQFTGLIELGDSDADCLTFLSEHSGFIS